MENNKDLNILKSKIPDIELPCISITEYVFKNLDKWTDYTAMVCIETKREYTFGQLHKRSLALTKFLKESLSVQNNYTVAIILPNVPEFPIVLFGALQAGLKVTTCNPNSTTNEMHTQLIDSEAKLIITCHHLVPAIKKSLENIEEDIKIISINHQNEEKPDHIIDFDDIIVGETDLHLLVNIDDVALLAYSSGTTGLPKGVQLTQKQILSNVCQLSVKEFNFFKETSAQHQDVSPAFLPFYHTYGLIQLLRKLALGVKVITIAKFNADVFIKLLREYRPNIIFGVPSTVLMINKNPNITLNDLSCIRILCSGAAPLHSSDCQLFEKKSQKKNTLLQLFGMTETCVLTQQTELIANGIKVGGSGILLPNTEARFIPIGKLIDKNLGPYEQGEILFRGPQVMVGYYNNPKANKDCMLDDNWIRSGDVGYYDEDGQIYITDRLKELIKVKGFQVAPAELEAILREHPEVDDAGVIGVPHEILGEAPKAFIVPKFNSTIKISDIEDFLVDKVSTYKYLAGGICFIGSIPRNSTGKIIRKKLLELHTN